MGDYVQNKGLDKGFILIYVTKISIGRDIVKRNKFWQWK